MIILEYDLHDVTLCSYEHANTVQLGTETS